LNLSNITSNFRNVAMLVTVDLQKKKKKAPCSIYTISLRTNFKCVPPVAHYLSPTSQKLKNIFGQPPCCNFTFYRNITLTEVANLFQDILSYAISEPQRKCRYYLTTLRIRHVVFTDGRQLSITDFGCFQWHNVQPKSREN
jgi:hypothetical protein